MPSSFASVMTVWRVMPASSECAMPGVYSTPSFTRNRFSPAPSLTVPSGAEADAFDEAETLGLEADELARQVVAAGLGHRGNRVGRDALPRRHAHIDAFIFGRAEILAPFPGGNGDFDRRIDLRHHADFAIAAECDGAQVGAARQAVLRNDFAAAVVDLVFGEGQVDAIHLGRIEQAVRVIAQPEDRRAARRLVGAHAFEHRGAVVQRMREHVHRGLFPGDQLAVEPDVFRCGYGHE